MKSLRSRLTAAVMMPLLALAITFGGVSCWMIHRTTMLAVDRALVASVISVGNAINTKSPIRDELLPLAVRLLENQFAPEFHYSVWDGKRLVAGDPRLSLPVEYDEATDEVKRLYEPAHFPATFRNSRMLKVHEETHDGNMIIQPAYLHDIAVDGRQMRVATEIRKSRQFSHPVIVQVADFLDDRRAYEQIYFLRVLGAGILIAMAALLLFYGAVIWGLRPFASLTEQIEAARAHPAAPVRLVLDEDSPREARLLATAFNDLMLRSERATLSLRQFTANASHQLRTPLAIMRVHLDVLDRAAPASRQGVAALADINAAVGTLERLLPQLIALARMDEDHGTLEALSPFDLTDLAANVIANRITEGDTGDMDIGFEADDEPVYALGNPMLVTEMLANLLDNAIRYNRADGMVTVRISRHRGLPMAQVEDDGPGIPIAAREKVWDRFYRVPGEDSPPGSGLGLPIVRAIAQKIGAHVSLSGGKGEKGLRATIIFMPPETSAESEFLTEIDIQ